MVGNRMEDKVIKPRCPKCGRVVAEWLEGSAGYTCPRCKLGFTLNTLISHQRDLTGTLKYANTISN